MAGSAKPNIIIKITAVFTINVGPVITAFISSFAMLTNLRTPFPAGYPTMNRCIVRTNTFPQSMFSSYIFSFFKLSVY